MKKLMLIFALIIAWANVAFSQQVEKNTGMNKIFGVPQTVKNVDSTAPQCISVSDMDFGTIRINSTRQYHAAISNLGDAPLIITGTKGPSNPTIFQPDFSQLHFPLTLQPRNTISFGVTFKPTNAGSFADQIVFSSNTNKLWSDDSVCHVVGQAVQATCLPTGYDWNKKPIKQGVYMGKVVIENLGNADMAVKKITVTPINSPNDINQFDISDLQSFNWVLVPGQCDTIHVWFNPQVEGDFALLLEFDTDSGQVPVPSAKLTGTGYDPVGVSEIQIQQNFIEISPNPAFGTVSIYFPADLPNTTISIFNSLGIEIKRFDEKEILGQSSLSFSTDDFPSGVYFCTMSTGTNKITKSFVVAK